MSLICRNRFQNCMRIIVVFKCGGGCVCGLCFGGGGVVFFLNAL